MGKKRVKSKKKPTVKAANRDVPVKAANPGDFYKSPLANRDVPVDNVPVGRYILAIVGVVCIACFWLVLTDISASVEKARRFTHKGYDHLQRKKTRAAHENLDKALAIAKKNNFMDRKPLLLAEIFTAKADTYAMTATTSALHPDRALKAIDLYWQAHRINKEMDVLYNIAKLHHIFKNYTEQVKVSQQVFDMLLADPQKAKQFGPKLIPGHSQDANQIKNQVRGMLRPMLSDFVISQRKLGNADIAADYFWEMKHVFPEYINWKDTYQTPTNFIAEGLDDQPWWEATGDWRREVEMHYEDILSELQQFLANNGKFELNADLPLIGKRESEEQVMKDDWSEIMLWEPPRFTKNCRAFPITCSLVHGISQITGTDGDGNHVQGQVTIFRLRPGSHLVPHVGTCNFRLTNHLGLIIPKGLSLRVANETRGWEQGKITVFDDSFEHEVWHNGTEDRYVLYMSSWKKEFGPMAPNTKPQFWVDK